MTLPDERYRAVVQTKKFLEELLTTPRVPKTIKDGARYCLRHYPSDWDMKRVADASPEVFQERMEPLYRMIKQHEQDKADDPNENITG
jgi:hypothetical protein